MALRATGAASAEGKPKTALLQLREPVGERVEPKFELERTERTRANLEREYVC